MRRRVLALPLLAAAAQAATVDLELPVCQPADPAPAVDGRLDDWRGIAALAVQPEGHPALGAEVRTAYDAQGLLLAAAWRSPRPPGAGDALGLRLTWAGRVVHLVARPEGEGAVLEVRRGGEVSARTIPGAAALAAAAGGWALEARLPWSELSPAGTAPLGRPLPAILDLAWGAEAAAATTVCTSLALGRRSPLAFRYRMPRDAEVTLGLYDGQGGLLRWLTRSEPRRAGDNTEWWDGRDQDGAFLPAGTYRVKALHHDPLGLDHRLSVGNPGNPPWSTVDGAGDWLGDEGNPMAAVSDGEWVWLASNCHEKGFRVIGLDGSGQRRWGGGGIGDNPRCVALAVDGDFLYLVCCGPEKTDHQPRFTGRNAENRALVACFDKRTGAPARFSLKQPAVKAATWPYVERMVPLWDLLNAQAYDPDTYGGLPRYGDCHYGEAAEVMGAAAVGGTLYLAFHTQGVLRAYDAATCAPTPERDIPLPRPVSLCARPDGSLLAVSGRQVVRIDPATGRAAPVVAAGLSAPFGVAAGRDGSIFVSDWRESHQVKVFSPDGRPLRAIGRAGGRPPLGAWQADAMLVPRGVAVTDAGKLWVAEDDSTPRRVSVWDAASGRLLRDFIGPTPYGGGSAFWFEPGDPTVLHAMGCRFRLDWTAKTWKPEAVEFRRMHADQPFAVCGANGMVHAVRPFTRDGRQYAAVAWGYDTLTIQMRDGESWRPVAAAGTRHRWATTDGSDCQIWDSDIGKHLITGFFPACFQGHAGDNYAWSDRNGDGLVQAEEMTWRKTIFRGDPYAPGAQPEFLLGWGLGSDLEGALLFGGECKVDGKAGYPLFRLAPDGWTGGGAPLYDIAKAAAFATVRTANALYADRRGNLLAPGLADALTLFDRDGRLLWRIAGRERPGRHDLNLASITGELDLPGIGAVYGTWNWHGNYRAYLVAADGMYVGTVQPDTKAGPAGLWDESWRFWYQAPDGTPYLVNGANQGQHILRVTGLEDAGRFETALTISEAEAARARAAEADDRAPAPAPRIRPIAMTWRTPAKVDGDLADWRMGEGVRIDLGHGRSALAAIARDADALHLAWQVEDDSPLRNLGGNWQTLFLSGDCVDLMLQTDAAAPAGRQHAAAGDLRLLFSVFQDRPVAVLYRPVVPGTRQPVQLMAARLDRIDLLEQAQVAVRRCAGGYAVEASVPFAALGLSTTGLDALRGDLGVISSDEAGRDRTRRSYHYNRRTQLTADLTTEASLQPAEWGAISLPLGPNLLRDGGFEEPLADDRMAGWCAGEVGQDTRVATAPTAAFSGQRGLLFRQLAPVDYPPEAYRTADFRDFLKAANGGRGGGGGVVRQRVPVQGGRHYHLRFRLRSEGTSGREVQRPAPDRGYTALHIGIDFIGPNGRFVGAQSVYDDREWNQVLDGGTHMLPRPALAPPGTTHAEVIIRAAINAGGLTPAFMVDEVELVEAR